MSHLFTFFVRRWWEVRRGGRCLRLLARLMFAAPLSGQWLSNAVLFPFFSSPGDARGEGPLLFVIVVVVFRFAQGGVIDRDAALLGWSFYDITEE